jgi:hypothetical protein
MNQTSPENDGTSNNIGIPVADVNVSSSSVGAAALRFNHRWLPESLLRFLPIA